MRTDKVLVSQQLSNCQEEFKSFGVAVGELTRRQAGMRRVTFTCGEHPPIGSRPSVRRATNSAADRLNLARTPICARSAPNAPHPDITRSVMGHGHGRAGHAVAVLDVLNAFNTSFAATLCGHDRRAKADGVCRR